VAQDAAAAVMAPPRALSLQLVVASALLRACSPQLMAQMAWAFNEPAEFPGFTLTSVSPRMCSCTSARFTALKLRLALSLPVYLPVYLPACLRFTPRCSRLSRYNGATLAEIGTNHSKYGIQALYLLDWMECRHGPGCCANKTMPAAEKALCCNSGCKPCSSPLLHYGPTPCKSPRPDLEQYWNQTLATLRPFIANRSVIGINLNDEMMWDGITVKDTARMADRIKSDWPEAIIYQNEAPGIGDCNYNRMNETVFTEAEPMIPKSVDWWGYDAYSFTNESWEQPIEAYKRNVFPRLHAHQRVVHVTTAFADPGYGESPNETATEIDAFCVQNAQAFLSWALTEPRVAAIVPFHWETTAGAKIGQNGVPIGHTGLGDRAVFPRCEAAWNAIGLLIQASRGNTTLRAPLPPLRGLPTQPIPPLSNAPHCVCERSNWRTPGSNRTCPWP
jgi:hypothetical protein